MMPLRHKEGYGPRHVRTFVTVAETGTVSKAAERLRGAAGALAADRQSGGRAA